MTRSVLQDWVHDLTLMQQSVLLSAIRGPDGQPKYNAAKMLLRWYRRCILISALDGVVLETPVDPRGGSFTGPSIILSPDAYKLVKDRAFSVWFDSMGPTIEEYMSNVDGFPAHYTNHFRDAMQVLGYKHPDEIIRHFWNNLYHRLVRQLNLYPEDEQQMDYRLGDKRTSWLSTSDPATQR